MRFRGPVILDEDEERKLEDRTAELAQLILYLQVLLCEVSRIAFVYKI